ncbi:MAG: DUF362 domain-containing protein [Planctomycetes bacterium]|nr:DUF362 domain-containing protein [Planctomycetota bacterium]
MRVSVPDKQVKLDTVLGARRTRRELLQAVAASAGVLAVAGIAPGRQVASRPAPPVCSPRPWWMSQHHPRSRVVDMRAGNVLRATIVDKPVLAELLAQSIQILAGVPDARSAWRSVLGSARRIVLKFNHVAADAIQTTDIMARTLVEALADAGYAPGTIALVEAPEHLTTELGTRRATGGWGESIVVGDSTEQLAAYLDESDAIINVPFLKTHQIAGMSGCLKNLSHALLRHPARYHANGCSPYVGQVVRSPVVSSKLKLNVVNALRVVVKGGPDAEDQDLFPYGGILLGYDPVAVDAIGLDTLARLRRQLETDANLRVTYLSSAADLDVGRRRLMEIEHLVHHAGAQ